MLVWNWRGIACERGTTTLRFWPYKQKKQSDECVDTLKCAKLTSASPWQQFIRHVIAFMFYYMHIEKHHQHPVWRHLRSSASTIHGTTWHATHRNSRCNNSKQSCMNRFFVRLAQHAPAQMQCETMFRLSRDLQMHANPCLYNQRSC